MLGNIKFLGELYKHDMLTDEIMLGCIQSLLSDIKHPQPDDIEALCELLSTIGFKINHIRVFFFLSIFLPFPPSFQPHFITTAY